MVSYSVVVPAYNESGNLSALYEALRDVFRPLDADWELIFVDDGSQDETWLSIDRLHQKDTRVKGLRLSRNFGHQNALIAGLKAATGNAVICMDGDMQHPPSLIPEMIENWRKGSKIVKTQRIDGNNLPWMKRVTSLMFYRLFAYMSGVSIRTGMADYRLFDSQVLEELMKFQEHDLFLRGLVEWVGYETSTVSYQSADRFSGDSKYTVKRMCRFAWNGITSFSLVPLRIGVGIGLVASMLAFTATIYAIAGKVITGTSVTGWSSSLAIISFLFGVLFLYLGLLGEYLGRVLIEARGRPRFLISEYIGVGSERKRSRSIPMSKRSEVVPISEDVAL